MTGTVYEADDEEADRIYEAVDAKLDERKRIKREAREKAEEETLRISRPTLQEQLAPYKRGLAEVTDEEWENIRKIVPSFRTHRCACTDMPLILTAEVNNLIGNRAKKPRLEGRSFAVPDSILVSARDSNAVESTLDTRQMVRYSVLELTMLDPITNTQSRSQAKGLETPANAMTDFAEIGQARGKMLSIKLEQLTESASGTSTTIDPKGYLTGLDSQILKTDAEIGLVPQFLRTIFSLVAGLTRGVGHFSDIKRARALLQSLIKTNPKHAPGWVAAAWLENVAGKSVAARKIIAQGCQHCSTSEDVWIAASELNVRSSFPFSRFL